MKRDYFYFHLFMAGVGSLFWGALCRREEGHCIAEYFINPRYLWIPYLTLFMVLAITLYFLALAFSGKTVPMEARPPWYLFIPLLLLPFGLQASPGSGAVTHRGEETVLTESEGNDGSSGSTEAAEIDETVEPKVYEDGLNHISHIVLNDAAYQDVEVEIIGQAAFSERLPEGTFYLFRFIIYCCAADAFPAGLIVTGYDGGDIEKDGWYRLRGRIGYLEVEGKEYVSVEAEELTGIGEPEYIYEALN